MKLSRGRKSDRRTNGSVYQDIEEVEHTCISVSGVRDKVRDKHVHAVHYELAEHLLRDVEEPVRNHRTRKDSQYFARRYDARRQTIFATDVLETPYAAYIPTKTSPTRP